MGAFENRVLLSDLDYHLMGLALLEARRAAALGEVPVGAVVALDGQVVARSHNQREMDQDPLAHCEILAIRESSRRLDRWRLQGCHLYVTLEPCAMCAGAMVQARVDRLIYGCTDPKAGAVVSSIHLLDAPFHNHRVHHSGGIRAEEASLLLKEFFSRLRR